MRTTLILLAALLLPVSGLHAQQPRIYDTPQEVPPPVGVQSLVGLEVVTTPDGFDNFDLGIDSGEPHASSNPLNPLWHFNAFNTNRTHRSTNGHDWTFAGPSFGTGFSMRGDPVTAYDSLGNLYYENMFSATSGSSILGCKVNRSTNNGTTWTMLGTAIDGVDKNWIACDQTAGPFANYVYTTMTADGGGGNFVRSTNFGATWTQTWNFPEQGLPGMMVAVGPDVMGGNDISGGCVYVVTNGGTTESSDFTFSRSTNGGAGFQQRSVLNVAGYVGTMNSIGRLVINHARTRPYPFIAADNSYGAYRGRLYLVYAANDPPGNGNKPDIFLQYSTNQGATWSARVRVNDNPNPTTTNEWFPAIWCDKETGRLYIKWYDMRNDPANNARAWVYGTYTDDGGATFAPNQKISNTDQLYPNPACTPNTNCYRGDYDAVSSNRYTSLSVWTDFRSGGYGSYAAYFPDFAMKVATPDTLRPADSTEVFITIPAVKLYTETVKFTATLLAAAPITFGFPDGDSLTTVPDSLRLLIRGNGAAPGTYLVSVTGTGPNGTPVHKRTIAVNVAIPAITMIAPVGGETWQTGVMYSIRWGSVLAGSAVRIELSRDAGVTYAETLFASTANDGIEPWLVAGPTDVDARIRVTSLLDTSIAATSGGDFTIAEPAVSVLTPAGGEIWDAGSLQSVQWNSAYLTGTVTIQLSRDSGASFTETIAAGTTNDGTESWMATGPGTGAARVRIVSDAIPAAADTSPLFTIYQPALSTLPGWNLVSLPVLVPDPRPEVVFPSAVSQAYVFTPGGYVVRDTLLPGDGYWLRFDSSAVIPFAGSPIAGDTIPVTAGWSLIGSLSSPVATDSIAQDPPGILVALYSYLPGTGYQSNPPVIQPGEAIWIRASAAGQLILRKPVAPPLPARTAASRKAPGAVGASADKGPIDH